jgi:hypothetical protein
MIKHILLIAFCTTLALAQEVNNLGDFDNVKEIDTITKSFHTKTSNEQNKTTIKYVTPSTVTIDDEINKKEEKLSSKILEKNKKLFQKASNTLVIDENQEIDSLEKVEFVNDFIKHSNSLLEISLGFTNSKKNIYQSSVGFKRFSKTLLVSFEHIFGDTNRFGLFGKYQYIDDFYFNIHQGFIGSNYHFPLVSNIDFYIGGGLGFGMQHWIYNPLTTQNLSDNKFDSFLILAQGGMRYNLAPSIYTKLEAMVVNSDYKTTSSDGKIAINTTYTASMFFGIGYNF